jgi:arylsulfatase A-like enzyme
VVVVADHGQGLGGHGWFAHRLLYQEQIHVPLLVRVPGEPSGAVVDDLVRTIDILPTVLDAAGRPIPAQARAMLDRPEESGAMTIRRIDPGAPMDPEELEKLRSLGYVGD